MQEELKALNEELKALHIGLKKAVEKGDDLWLGIVIGQVIYKLEELINENSLK